MFYLEKDKQTNGQAFWRALNLLDESRKHGEFKTVLLNISVSLKTMIKFKLKGKRIVLRLDGLYLDRMSEALLVSVGSSGKRAVYRSLWKLTGENTAASLFNFFNRNYGVFIRIFFADFLVFQSEFSRVNYPGWVRKKKNTVIINGHNPETYKKKKSGSSMIKLVCFGHKSLPAKRLGKTVELLQYLDGRNPGKFSLLFVGLDKECCPKDLTEDHWNYIDKSDTIEVIPRFATMSDTVKRKIAETDIYICFSYNDWCPNSVIESMAHQIPVVGTDSGGLKEIVGSAGELITQQPYEGKFFPHRYELDFPDIDFELVEEALFKVYNQLPYYQGLVRKKFEEELDIRIAYERYAELR